MVTFWSPFGHHLVTFSFEGGDGIDDSEGTSKIDKDKTL